ncbi:OmpA family protein [Cochlodiniinecator piscidefendens]|uniref:OmpA family protein n=1 Tax=Cochlodiniinecator piscidefendens TaxID=2715756 RepID=UPI00140A228A|nr:OmpA family protein [Cochlodiniinecator piscidefendens]
MRLSSSLIVLSAITSGAILSFVAATVSAGLVENASQSAIERALTLDGIDWADVSADGLQVELIGIAPTEAERFRALTVAGTVIDAHRVLDHMMVQAAADIAPPRFSVEILRNDTGISLIGLIPANTDRDAVVSSISAIADGATVTDLLETADYPTPRDWDVALSFGIEMLADLPRSKVSISPDEIAITAISNSREERADLINQVQRSAPSNVALNLNISAPRPVITPFTLRFLIENGVGRFDACSADTPQSSDDIIAAAKRAGLEGEGSCRIGLGNPSPHWGTAVTQTIAALAELGAGSITFSDADISLVTSPDVSEEDFDRVISHLDADLPDVFSLSAIRPEPVTIDGTGESTGIPEFIATLSPEGQVQLRGLLTNDRTQAAVEGYARARFGVDSTYTATRLNPELPDGWPLRILTGLEALAELTNGSLVVQPDFVELRGTTGNPDASAEVSRILSAKLGQAENFSVDVTYDERLDPVLSLPTPEECVASINAILAETKIVFAPGSTEVDLSASDTIDAIAEQIELCETVPMEIGGHTDSQGRETMNQSLSQQRAQSVVNALMGRRVLTGNLTARGYGETVPIADNDTDAGREANRRIEFTLIESETPAEDTAEAPAEETAQEEASETPTGTDNGQN